MINIFLAMENSYETYNGNGVLENGHTVTKHMPYQPSIKVSLPWLDLRVFYVRVSKCEIDDSTPQFLTVTHTPLHPDTLLEVNGVRTSVNSDGPAILLRRDRLDRKSEEATFVSTDSIRITGSARFEVFDKSCLLLSGVLELCYSNGIMGESRSHAQKWNMNCESEVSAGGNSFLKAKQCVSSESTSPTVEVYVAGSFLGTPIILTKTLQFSSRKNLMRKGGLDSIPEYETSEGPDHDPSRIPLQMTEYSNFNYSGWGTEYIEGEDGELSWFNAGVRVGVGIGLSVCVGIGIGVGLLVQTYQGTARNFRRRLL